MPIQKKTFYILVNFHICDCNCFGIYHQNIRKELLFHSSHYWRYLRRLHGLWKFLERSLADNRDHDHSRLWRFLLQIPFGSFHHYHHLNVGNFWYLPHVSFPRKYNQVKSILGHILWISLQTAVPWEDSTFLSKHSNEYVQTFCL